jgi:hypothetical protein
MGIRQLVERRNGDKDTHMKVMMSLISFSLQRRENMVQGNLDGKIFLALRNTR